MTEQTKHEFSSNREEEIFNKMDDAHKAIIEKCWAQGRDCIFDNMFLNPYEMTALEFKNRVIHHLESSFLDDMEQSGARNPRWAEDWMMVLIYRLGMSQDRYKDDSPKTD
jgi:hypothetical protein